MILLGSSMLIATALTVDVDSYVATAMGVLGAYVLYLGYMDVDARTRSRRCITKDSVKANSIKDLTPEQLKLFRSLSVEYKILLGDRPIVYAELEGKRASVEFMREFLELSTETHLHAIRNYTGYDRDAAWVATTHLIRAGHAKEAHGSEAAEILSSRDECWDYLIPTM